LVWFGFVLAELSKIIRQIVQFSKEEDKRLRKE